MVNEEKTYTNAEKSLTTLTSNTSSRHLRMKQGNCIAINQIPFSPVMFNMCEEQELVEVKPVYAYDEQNRPILDKVEAITYTCVDGKNWYTYKVPNQTKPIITQEELDRRDAESNPVFIRIPLDKVVFKPYQTASDRGTVHISLQVPHIELL